MILLSYDFIMNAKSSYSYMHITDGQIHTYYIIL